MSFSNDTHNASDRERTKITEFVGGRANASNLFVSKMHDADAEWVGRTILGRLNFVNGDNALYTNFDCLSDEQVSQWATQCWANTIAHLCQVDAEVRAVVSCHRSMLPDDAAAQELLIKKVLRAFGFFLWLLAGPTKPLSQTNVCVIKLIVLHDALLLEEIQSIRDGTPGGWGLLDKTISGLRDVGRGLEIKVIKAIATNKQVYNAFLRRGFRDQVEIVGFTRPVTNYSKALELLSPERE